MGKFELKPKQKHFVYTSFSVLLETNASYR